MRTLTTMAAALLALALLAGPAAATSGGTDKYGGHTPSEKSATEKYPAGVYHCHGTGAKRAMCDMRARAVEQQNRLNKLEIEASVRARELAAALKANDELRRKAASAKSYANIQARAVREARKKLDVANRAKADAIRDMKEAELRAAGYGPAVSSRCKAGVLAALDSGWRFSAAEKESLRKACLY